MDMILAFVCGLGLFHLLLLLLPLDSPSPIPAENTTPQKVLRKEHRKVRKKIRTVKAYRGRLRNQRRTRYWLHFCTACKRSLSIHSICRHLGQDASYEAFIPDAAKAYVSPRHPTRKSVATKSSLETSTAPRNEVKDSKPLSKVLQYSSPIESRSSESASWPPETLTTGRCHSPPQKESSYPSHPLDLVACPLPIADPNMEVHEFDWKILVITKSSQTLPGLPSPMTSTPGINFSRRPISTAPGLNYYSRSTSASLDIDHLSRPTSSIPGLDHSTTTGLDHLSRPTSTNLGLDFLSKPTSTTRGHNFLSRLTSTTSGLEHSSRPTSTIPGLDHLSKSTSTTSGFDPLGRPTSTTS